MVWVGSGKNFHVIGWVGCKNLGLGFKKVTHVQLCYRLERHPNVNVIVVNITFFYDFCGF